MSKNSLLALSAVLLSSIAALGACGKDDPITALDRTTDCADICDRYQRCIDSDYNTDACEDRCTDMTSNGETDMIDACAACTGESTSCVSKVFQCSDDCVGIIP